MRRRHLRALLREAHGLLWNLPHFEDEWGQIIKATVAAFGDTAHSFIERAAYFGSFLLLPYDRKTSYMRNRQASSRLIT